VMLIIDLHKLFKDTTEAREEPPSYRATTYFDTTPATELDLRGLTFEEAQPELDKYLDAAAIAGLGQVTIIHGKGTGALRAKIQEHLKNHRRVKSFRLGYWNEGSYGVTIVEINKD
jgi:dsDNA-specific endonuclease/ATPase MutS2